MAESMLAQNVTPLFWEAIPAGPGPAGLDVLEVAAGGAVRTNLVAVANSRGDSVSVFQMDVAGAPDNFLGRTIRLQFTIGGIPRASGVSFCTPLTGALLVVTSPAEGSLTVLRPFDGAVLGKIQTGPEPYSVSCRFTAERGTRAVVSNFGDSSVTVVDVDRLTILGRVADVPGSRSPRAVLTGGTRAWVAGSDGNALTVVDLDSLRVVNRLPVRGAYSVGQRFGALFVTSPPDNAIVSFNSETLQSSRLPALSPKHFLEISLGMFAIAGNDRVLTWIPGGASVEGVTGGVDLGVWSFRTGPVSIGFGILVTSMDTDRLFLVQRAPPMGTQFGAVNAASFAGREVAPGSLASTFFSTGATRNFVADTLPLPITLGGVSLRVGGSVSIVNGQPAYSPEGSTLAPLLFVGPNQINFQLPPQVAPAEEVFGQLIRPDGSTVLGVFRVVPTFPGIFTLTSDGRGWAVVLNQDNTLNQGTNAAPRGSIIQLFATGAGATDIPLAPGEAAPLGGNPLVRTLVQPTVTIGGRPARVLFSGMAPGLVGVWQINAEVPREIDPSPVFVSLTISAGGFTSNTVSVAVQ